MSEDAPIKTKSRATARSWWYRRNMLEVSNGDLVLILCVALIAGAVATYVTAFLGVR